MAYKLVYPNDYITFAGTRVRNDARTASERDAVGVNTGHSGPLCALVSQCCKRFCRPPSFMLAPPDKRENVGGG